MIFTGGIMHPLQLIYMGRPFGWHPFHARWPEAVSAEIETLLKNLKNGDRVHVTFKSASAQSASSFKPEFIRSPSIYSGIALPRADGEYVVENSNFEPNVTKITSRNTLILIPVEAMKDRDKFFADWVVTDDGYVRECEAYGILSNIASIKTVVNE